MCVCVLHIWVSSHSSWLFCYVPFIIFFLHTPFEKFLYSPIFSITDYFLSWVASTVSPSKTFFTIITLFFISIIYFLNFYWSIVDLQCFASFRYTTKWISYTYTYAHSFLDSFPIKAITEYWIEFPVLYSRNLFVIYFIYSSVYMSLPISQFIPPHPVPPGNQKFIFYICNSISVL